MIDLYKKTIYRGREIIAEVERSAGLLSDSMATSLNIEDTVMFIPEGDVDKWLDVFSRTKRAPKAFITFSPQQGPKYQIGLFRRETIERAEQTIEYSLERAGVQKPNIQFSEITGREISDGDIIGKSIKHLTWKVIEGSNEMFFNTDHLVLQKPVQ